MYQSDVQRTSDKMRDAASLYADVVGWLAEARKTFSTFCTEKMGMTLEEYDVLTDKDRQRLEAKHAQSWREYIAAAQSQKDT